MLIFECVKDSPLTTILTGKNCFESNVVTFCRCPK